MTANKKKTGILGVLIAILALGIGYAAITAIPMVISGTGTIVPDQENFAVKFTGTPTKTGTGTLDATITDDTHATLSVTDLKKKGDTATFTFTIENASAEEIDAELKDLTVENSNETYFEVTSAFATTDPVLAKGETTTVTVTVKALKPAVEEDVTSTIKVTLNANPKTAA